MSLGGKKENANTILLKGKKAEKGRKTIALKQSNSY